MNRRLGPCLVGIAVGIAGLGTGCGKHETPPPPPPQAAQAPGQPPAQYPPPGPVPAPYAYYYYPDVEVYYYPVSDVYWWFDGVVWVSGPQPPPRFVLRDSMRVTVNLNSPEPWRQHTFVVREHPRR